MKTRLRCLSVCLLAVVAPLVYGWQQTAPRAVGQPAGGINPRQVLTTARLKLLEQQSLTALVRQQVWLFGHEMVAAGDYRQWGRGETMQVRYEMAMQVAGRTAKLLQVSGGQFLWTETDWEDVVPHITRVDRRKARKALEETSPVPPSLVLPFGGLCDLLASLEESFQFDSPKIQQAQETGRHFYTLRGRWTPERLRSMLPEASPEEASRDPRFRLPEHVPHEVQIWLGRDDLFPYMIQYYRLLRDPDGAPQQRLLLRLQFYDVRPGAPVDGRDFVYEPAKGNFTDVTDQWIHKVKARASRAVAAWPQPAPR